MGSTRRFSDDLTLREAIDLHRTLLGDVALGMDDQAPPETRALFDGHDAIHAVYDCGIDLVGETLADTWTLSGTTMTLGRYLLYLQQPVVSALFRSLGVVEMSRALVRALPSALRAWRRGRAQSKAWAFDAWEDHLDRTLGDIRREHGIHLLPLA